MVNHILLTLDPNSTSALQLLDIGLLDISTAFDTIDHIIVSDQLENLFHSGLALAWLKSYLLEITQSVSYNVTPSIQIQICSSTGFSLFICSCSLFFSL